MNPRLFGGPKFSGPGIKAIDHYLVQAKVGGKGIPVRTIQDHAMGVWAFLALSLLVIVIVVVSSPALGEFFDLLWLKIKVALNL